MAFKLMTNRATDYVVVEADWDAITDNFAAINGWNSIPLFPASPGMPPLSGLVASRFSIIQSSGAGTIKPQRSVLSHADGTDEGRIWEAAVPRSFGLTVTLVGSFYMVSASSGNVVVGAQIAAIGDEDTTVDAKVFDTVTLSTIAVPASAKKEKAFSFSLAAADLDDMAANDHLNIAFYRDADHASDTATGDMNLTRLALFYNVTATTV